MVANITGIEFSLYFLVRLILITYRLPQIFELCHIFEGLSLCCGVFLHCGDKTSTYAKISVFAF
jgi:hypothetical protein